MSTLLWRIFVAWLSPSYEVPLVPRQNFVPPFVDYLTYINAASRMLAGQSLYAPVQLTGSYHPSDVVLVGYVYPPPSALLFLVFRPELLGLLGWGWLNIGLLIAGMSSIARRELPISWPTAIATALVTLTLFLRPLADGLVSGNVNVALAGLLALCWSVDRWALASAGAAVGGIVKIYPAFLALWVRRPEVTRSLLLAAATGAAMILITLPVVGINTWRDFAMALSNAVPVCPPYPSIPCALAPAVGLRTAGIIALTAGAGLGALSLFARDRRTRFLLIAYAMIVPVPDLWLHYWLIPFVAAFAAVTTTLGPAFQRLDQLGPA